MHVFRTHSAGDTETAELYLDEDEALRALDDCLKDEPAWRETVYVRPVDFRTSLSPN